MRKIYRLGLMVGLIFGLMLLLSPKEAGAQWPPFRFSMTPSHEDGKITYELYFNKSGKVSMADVAFKVPIPEGTRFLEAASYPNTSRGFDGVDVTFFTGGYILDEIDGVFLTVEIVDPTQTVFTTHAEISWKTDQPGSYVTEDVSIDISRQSLEWDDPSQGRLDLNIQAQVEDETITYFIYPINRSQYRMWDLKINVPIPEGTTFVSAEAPPPFTANYDGREAYFSIVEIARNNKTEPLKLKVSTAGAATPLVVTHAWASWKNSNRRVGTSVTPQEELRSSDIIIQPGSPAQRLFSDPAGDTPLSNYDLIGVAFESYASALKVALHTAGDVGPLGGTQSFTLLIDNDCNPKTGKLANQGDRTGVIGADYQLRYRHDKGRVKLDAWYEEGEEKGWQPVGRGGLVISNDNRTIGLIISTTLLDLQDSHPFCWIVEAKNNSQDYTVALPTERVIPGQQGLILTPTNAAAPSAVILNDLIKADKGTFIRLNDIWQYLPGWSEPDPNWNKPSFDDSGWYSGRASIGYGQGKIKTHLETTNPTLQADNGPPVLVQRTITETGVVVASLTSGADHISVFLRRAFEVPNPDKITQLTLEIDYEDGFVAYLNGREVARRGLEGSPDIPVVYDAWAVEHPSGEPELIDLSDYISDLLTSTNVLALQVHRSVNPPLNLYVAPKLAWSYTPPGAGPSEGEPAVLTDVAPAIGAAGATPTEIRGKLAVPIDNGRVAYDIHIFSLPDGQEIVQIPNARQPNFRFDGQRLLINHEGGGVENLFEYNLEDGFEKQVSDAPRDTHPFYDPWGNRVVYGNPELIISRDGQRRPFIFVQCSLQPPHQEIEDSCRDIAGRQVLIPAGQTTELQGTHPLWTANDMITYNGCNTWAGSRLCGIFIVSSASTKSGNGGLIPRQLTRESKDTPADSKGDLIVFNSYRDGNWEAYVMDVNGNNLKNLSNSPTSNDGLPTISPDGAWVAFVSDRDSRWAIWVVPAAGGPAQKLFDLPADKPWGDGDRTWTNERISWGP